MFCVFCGKKISVNSKFCKYCGKKNDKERNEEAIQKSRKIMRQALIVGTTFFIVLGLVSGSVLAYSLKTKQVGDVEYKSQNYKKALEKYQKAKTYWFLEKISYKLRDRDLEIKINKANIMIKSGNYYQLGVEAFNNKNYSDAKIYLSKLAEKDPHFQEAQRTIQKISEVTRITPTPTYKPIQKSFTAKVYPTTTPIPQRNLEESWDVLLKQVELVKQGEQDTRKQELYNQIYNECIKKKSSSLGDFLINDSQRARIMEEAKNDCAAKAEAEVY
jgi:tetratricopeptide (TPR) repeat protein